MGGFGRLLLQTVLDVHTPFWANHYCTRELTRDPILIAETSVSPATNQPAKMANLFAGIRLYGLYIVWFNSVHEKDWRLTNSAAIAAFHQGASTYGYDCLDPQCVTLSVYGLLCVTATVESRIFSRP